jgi:hypothetical protein
MQRACCAYTSCDVFMVWLTRFPINAGYLGMECAIMKPFFSLYSTPIIILECARLLDTVPLGFSSFQARVCKDIELIC